jgi:putative transport protein
MIAFLVKNPLLLLFVTAALGYAIGRIRIKGASLGVAAVLFVGLFIGSFSPDLKIPDFAFTFGLAVFVYTIGLSSGAGFFASFTRKGLRDNIFIFTMLLLAFGMVLLSAGWFGLKPTVAAGVFAGSLTNTPALGGVLDAIRNAAGANLESVLAEPVVGYSVTYPLGVLGPIFAILIMSRVFRINYRKEAARLKAFNLVEQEIYNVTVRVGASGVTSTTLHEFTASQRPNVVFGRFERNGVISLADGSTRLQPGDLVSIVGGPEDVDAAAALLGTVVDEHLDFDRSNYDFRRIFVSHGDVVGRKIGDLKLPEKYDAIITRVRRGDVDFLANANTVLELGDRVRVVAARGRMKEVSEFFGDSYKDLSEVDLLSFGLGMSLGLLLGLVPIPLPGGVTITLGSAGGPLLVALVLGALRRTGPIVWTMPYSANLTLRQLGLIMLLATVGLKSGYTFLSTFTQSGGVVIFLAGAIISTATPLLALFVGYKLLKIPFGMLTGMVASMHTQPAVLGFANEQSEDEAPNLGWSLVFPLATISKIILAQLLLSILSRAG